MIGRPNIHIGQMNGRGAIIQPIIILRTKGEYIQAIIAAIHADGVAFGDINTKIADLQPGIVGINQNARRTRNGHRRTCGKNLRLGGDIGDAAFHTIAINPDAVFGKIGVDIAGVESGGNAGSRGAEAQGGARTEDENIIQKDAIHPAENQRIQIALLPIQHVTVISVEVPEVNMVKPADIKAAIHFNATGENLPTQAPEAHAPGIVAPNAAIDRDQIDILKIHGAEAILDTKHIIIIGWCP